MKTIQTVVLAMGLTGVLAWSAAAQEVVTGGDLIADTRALGMGGAQIAVPGGPGSVLGNPAALARTEDLETQLGLMWVSRGTKTSLSGVGASGTGDVNDSAVRLGTFGVAYPVPTMQGSMVFALGYNRVKDFTGTFQLSGYDSEAFVDGDDVWGGYFDNETAEEGGVDVISLAGAVDVSPHVSLGLSLDIWNGSYSVDKRVVRNDYEGQVSWLDLTGGDDDISGWSIKPAILYFDRLVRAGAYLQLPMKFTVDQNNYEELYSTNDGYYFNLHERIDSYIEDNYSDYTDYWSAEYGIEVPMELGLGLSLGEPGVSCVAADVVFKNWRDADFDDDEDPYYFRDRYRDTVTWRVGVEQRLPIRGIVARAGYLHDPSPFKGPREDDGPKITITDDRDFFTVGLSARLDPAFSLDVAYAHGFWRGEEGSRVDEKSLDRLYATVTYRLPVIGMQHR